MGKQIGGMPSKKNKRSKETNDQIPVLQSINEVDNQILSLFSEIKQLKSKFGNKPIESITDIEIKNQLVNKINLTHELIHKQISLSAQLPIEIQASTFLERISELDILSDNLAIKPGDALIDVNIVIEGIRTAK